MQATQQGIILGTAAYMSPEQARGEATDRRADVWAFGCVLFEILTGRGTFEGRSVSDVLASVLKIDPDWNSLPLNLHQRIRMLLERCLEKEVKDRYQTISDARVDVQKVLGDPSGVLVQPVAEVVQAAPQSKLPWVAAIAVTAIIAGLTVWFLRPIEPLPVSRSEYVLPDGRNFRRGTRPVLRVSSDGSKFVYNAIGGLYLRSLDELESRVISGTEGVFENPIFSPGGEWLAYWSLQDRQLKKIATVGGTPVSLAEVLARPNGISWDVDDTILYGASEGIMRVSADGGSQNFSSRVWRKQILDIQL